MTFDELETQLNKFHALTAQTESRLARVTAAANKAESALNSVASKANLQKIAGDAGVINKRFEMTQKTLRTVDTRLETVERSMEDVNHEARGMREYNQLVQKGVTQTDKLEKALTEVTAELREQGELMRRMAKYQDELYEQRRRRAAKQLRGPDGRFAPMGGGAAGADPTSRGAILGGAIAGRASRGGLGGAPIVAGYAAGHAARSALGNAFALNQLLTTIRAEGATDRQVDTARQTILEVSGQTRFTAEDVGTYILNSIRQGFDVMETTRALPTIAGLGIAEDKSLEDAGRVLSEAAQALERPLSQMSTYAEQITRATSMSPLRPEMIEFINQRALSSFRIAGGTETDLLAILAELRKTVSSGRLLGTALKSIPADLNAVMQGRGTRRQQDVWGALTGQFGLQTQGKDFLQIFHDIGQIALKHDKSIILDLFGDEAGLRIQQLITEQKLNNILQNRQKLLDAEGELQRKVDIQRESAMNTFLRLISSVTTASITLVNAIGGTKMQNFNSLMESGIALVERFTRFVDQNKDRISAPFRRLADWAEKNRDSFAKFFKSFLDTIKPVVGLLVAMAKGVATLITDFPRLTGALAASFVVWKLLGGHISNAALGMQSLWGLMKRGIPAGGLGGTLQTTQAGLEGVARRRKIAKAGGYLHKTGRVYTGTLATAGGVAAEGAVAGAYKHRESRTYTGKLSRKMHTLDDIAMVNTRLKNFPDAAGGIAAGTTAARGGMLARGLKGIGGIVARLAPLLPLLKGIGVAIGGVISTLGAPLIAVIAAVSAAFVGLGALILRNWDKVKGLFSSIGEFFGVLFDYIGSVVGKWIEPVHQALDSFLSGFKDAFGEVWEGLKEIGGWIENVFIAGLEKAKGIFDAMTGWVIDRDPEGEFRRTQRESQRYFRGETFRGVHSETRDALLEYRQRAGALDSSYMQNLENYKTLLNERDKIVSGESSIRTREGLENFQKTFDIFLSGLKKEVSALPEKVEQPLRDVATDQQLPALPPMGDIAQSANIQRVDPTSVEYVDFRSVADLENVLQSGFTTLANINTGILDALTDRDNLVQTKMVASKQGDVSPITTKAVVSDSEAKVFPVSTKMVASKQGDVNPMPTKAVLADADTTINPMSTKQVAMGGDVNPVPTKIAVAEPRPFDMLAPGVPDMRSIELAEKAESGNVQHIQITINGAEKDPQEVAREVVAELDRQQRTNQFGY